MVSAPQHSEGTVDRATMGHRYDRTSSLTGWAMGILLWVLGTNVWTAGGRVQLGHGYGCMNRGVTARVTLWVRGMSQG